MLSSYIEECLDDKSVLNGPWRLRSHLQSAHGFVTRAPARVMWDWNIWPMKTHRWSAGDSHQQQSQRHAAQWAVSVWRSLQSKTSSVDIWVWDAHTIKDPTPLKTTKTHICGSLRQSPKCPASFGGFKFFGIVKRSRLRTLTPASLVQIQLPKPLRVLQHRSS